MADPIQVLLVEDDTVDARAIRRLLEAEGSVDFDLEQVERLQDAVDRAGAVDVVVLDLGLPDSQGIETLRRMREDGPDVPIVILTGLQDQDVALQALRRGASDYLVKDQIHRFSLVHSIRSTVLAAKDTERPVDRPERDGSPTRDGIVAGAGEEIKTRSTFVMNNLSQIEQLAQRMAQDSGDDRMVHLAEASRDAMGAMGRIDKLARELVQMGPEQGPTRSTLRAPVISAVNLFQSMRPADVGLDAQLGPTEKVEIDFLGIQQAVLGLLKAGSQEVPAGGRIVVLTTDAEDEAEVRVRVEPAEGDRVAMDGGSPRSADALQSVKELVEDNGGALDYGKTPDGGLVFRIAIPTGAGNGPTG